MADDRVSTSDLPSYVLDGLFDSFGEETISDDNDFRHYDDAGELSNETDRDNGSKRSKLPKMSPVIFFNGTNYITIYLKIFSSIWNYLCSSLFYCTNLSNNDDFPSFFPKLSATLS